MITFNNYNQKKRTKNINNLVYQKFLEEPLRSQLLATEDAYLEETNHWGDTYWGVCKGVGENMLGKILMMARDIV